MNKAEQLRYIKKRLGFLSKNAIFNMRKEDRMNHPTLLKLITNEIERYKRRYEVVADLKTGVLYKVTFTSRWSYSSRSTFGDTGLEFYGKVKTFNKDSARFQLLAMNTDIDTDAISVDYDRIISVRSVTDQSELLLCVGWEFKSKKFDDLLKSGKI